MGTLARREATTTSLISLRSVSFTKPWETRTMDFRPATSARERERPRHQPRG